MISPSFVRFLDRTTPPHIVTLVLLTGLGALNMSIFLPSLAQMAEEFGTTYGVMQLSVSSYLAAVGVLQLFVGPISDRFGRRRVLLWSLAIFLIASLGAMTAQSVGAFLIFRMMQATVASTMVLSRAIIRDVVSLEESASMIGYVTMGMSIVPLLGPMIGGALAEAFDWRASFAFLVAAGGAVWLLCWFDLGETVRGGGTGFAEQLATYPELLTSPRFWGYSLCAAFGSGAFFALLGGASYVSTDIFLLTPFWTGVALGAPALGYMLGNFLSGRYSQGIGVDRMALAGTAVTLAGLTVSATVTGFVVDAPLVFFGFCFFIGLGNGMMLPNVMAGLISVRPHLAGTASGLGGTLMVAGGAGLSQLAGGVMSPGSGTLPLLALMWATSAASVLSILYVMRRARRLA